MRHVAPITQIEKSEVADYAALPGIESFCQSMKESVPAIKRNAVQARIEAMMLAREIYVYAMRDDVATTVDLINERKKKSPDYKGGSPIKAHRYAMAAVVDECKVTMRTLSNWMRDWQETAKALSLELDCERGAFEAIANQAPDKHLWLETLQPEDAATANAIVAEMTPEKIAQIISKVFVKAFISETGHVKLNKQARIAVMRELNPTLGKVGFELTPTGAE